MNIHTDIEEFNEDDDRLYNLQEEEVVYLNKGCCDEQIVTIKAFKGGRCIVQDANGERFHVSAMRLTKP